MSPEEYEKHMEDFLQRVRKAVFGKTEAELDKKIMSTVNKKRHHGLVNVESMEWLWKTGREMTAPETMGYCFGKAGVDKERGWKYTKQVLGRRWKDVDALQEEYNNAYDTATFDADYRCSFK